MPSNRHATHEPDARLGPSLSAVIPAWDESGTIGDLVTRLRTAVENRVRCFEALVVVARPDDPTIDAAREAGARVLVQKRPGYGGALREGLRAAGGDLVVTMDADLSHPPETVCELLERADEADVVVASRYVGGAGAQAMSWHRGLLSRILNGVYRRILAVPVRDLSSGFRLYHRDDLSELDLSGESYDILEEILVQLYSQGRCIVEVPFAYGPRVSGDSHADVIGFAPHFLATLLRLWKLRNTFDAADYDSRAHDSIILPQRYWQRKRFRLVQHLSGNGLRRLDVGCGSSRILQANPEATGMDLAMPKLRFLRRTNRRLIRGDLFRLPFADAAFDTLICSQVIEHVAYQPRIFTELNRVLESGGTLVIGTPDYARIWWRLIEWLYKALLPNAYGDDHITKYTRIGLNEELAEAGFAIREHRYILGGELIMRCEKFEDVEDTV